MRARICVRAGMVFRAAAPRVHFRYVRVLQVRGRKDGAPYVFVCEVGSDGRNLTGRRRGIVRGAPFIAALTWSGSCWSMAPAYEACS